VVPFFSCGARPDDCIGAFHQAIEIATPAAVSGKLVTFGVCPTGPETGYGYIKASSPSKHSGNENAVLDVDAFVEKPDGITAAGYVASGDYFWNSGSSCLPQGAILQSWKDVILATSMPKFI
jgi:mannose-1-phosphate guanylyltransferase/mannose-6-phosphate isomerase